jgi:hypothetical protein
MMEEKTNKKKDQAESICFLFLKNFSFSSQYFHFHPSFIAARRVVVVVKKIFIKIINKSAHTPFHFFYHISCRYRSRFNGTVFCLHKLAKY